MERENNEDGKKKYIFKIFNLVDERFVFELNKCSQP